VETPFTYKEANLMARLRRAIKFASLDYCNPHPPAPSPAGDYRVHTSQTTVG
jgi:hypothetical protein